MKPIVVGDPAHRVEDTRFLRGTAIYLDDINLPRQAFAYFLRSPHAHARISAIDLTPARVSPKVLGVFSGVDYAREGHGMLRTSIPRRRRDGLPMVAAPHPGLVADRVRFVGDLVAMVVAESPIAARDAAEIIDVTYEPLGAVTCPANALGASKPIRGRDNESFYHALGDEAAVKKALESAAHIVRRRYVVSRVMANPLEPRGCIGDHNVDDARSTIYAAVSKPHVLREYLANDIFGQSELQFRVVSPEIGGSFGCKGPDYPELRLVLWAARRLGRPIKWVCDRSEGFVSDDHARDIVADAVLALDASGKFRALRVSIVANVGAYLSSDRGTTAQLFNLGSLAGVYTIAAIYAEVTGVFTNTNVVAPYRGAGAPEACYIIERLIDDAAAEIGLDRLALRRENLIPRSSLPYCTQLGDTLDSGDFGDNLAKTLTLVEHSQFGVRYEDARQRGKLRGLGVCCVFTQAAHADLETAQLRFDKSGLVTLLVGTNCQGQGHETMYRQILGTRLGVAADAIRLVDGDTDQVSYGRGTFGARSAVIGGSAVALASDKIVAKAVKIAGHMLETAETDIGFAAGRFTVVGTNQSVSIADVARVAHSPGQLPPEIEPGLDQIASYVPQGATFPNGCHACEVEIDVETGAVEIVRYVAVSDVGTVINPLLADGQIHGAIVQGIGQALMEQIQFDAQSGQLLSGSFMDYALPRADNLCPITTVMNPHPTKGNPLGAKGAGELGVVGALAATMLAVEDGLRSFGSGSIEMPATSEQIWRALRAASCAQAGGLGSAA